MGWQNTSAIFPKNIFAQQYVIKAFIEELIIYELSAETTLTY